MRMVLIGGMLMLALLVAIVSSVSAERLEWLPTVADTPKVAGAGQAG